MAEDQRVRKLQQIGSRVGSEPDLTALSGRGQAQIDRDYAAARARGDVAAMNRLNQEALQQQQPEQQEVRRAVRQRQFREQDIARGGERAAEIAPEGVLGRLQGMGAPEAQAARETKLRNLQRLQSLQQRQLQGGQARAGVTGGLASGQLVDLQRQQLAEQAAAEQAALLQQEAINRQVEQFNLGQLGKEFAARQAITFGEAGLGAAERGAVMNLIASEAAADATREAGGGGKK